MQTFKNVQNTPQSVITSEDIDIIFYKIPELHRIHFNFIKNLEPKLEKWTGEEEIAENFKILVCFLQFIIYMDMVHCMCMKICIVELLGQVSSDVLQLK
jgi:hypothetical protein